MMTTQSITGIRWYIIGEEIPDHGRVVGMSSTAYLVEVPSPDMQSRRWIPFYGPNGVHTAEAQAVVGPGLVTFADGSRYEGPCGARVVCRNRLSGESR